MAASPKTSSNHHKTLMALLYLNKKVY